MNKTKKVKPEVLEVTEKNTVENSNNKSLRVLAIILGILTGLCCLCFFCFFSMAGSITSIFFADYATFNKEFRSFCNIPESKLSEIYEEKFTTDYKRRVTYNEFLNFYKENKNFFETCSGLESNSDLFKSLITGFSIDIEVKNGQKVLNTSIKTVNGNLRVEAIEVLDDWKINKLDIVEN